MQVLFTGASSGIGVAVLKQLLELTDWEFHCVRHRCEIPVDNPRVHLLTLDLESDLDDSALPDGLGLTIHFAAVTHARDAERYWNVNFAGTRRLAAAVQSRGCRRFVYISTRCASEGSGAYGESKVAAEGMLQDLDWTSLQVIRPSEIYGGDSGEGLDKLISLARDKHVVPALFGDRRIRFSPLFIEDFVSQSASLIAEMRSEVSIVEMCGPEELSGKEIAWRLARAFRAVPIPVWWPALTAGLRAAEVFGIYPLEPDQADRLMGDKTCRVSSAATLTRFYPGGSQPR